MKLDTYRQALRYATYIEWRTPKDIVHDAYLQWYDKTGKDLFDEDAILVMSMVKYAIRRHYQKSRPTFMWRGEFYPRTHIPVSTDFATGCYTPSIESDQEGLIDNQINNLRLSLKLTTNEKVIFVHIKQGFSQTEVSKKLKNSVQAVHAALCQIRVKAIKLGIN